MAPCTSARKLDHCLRQCPLVPIRLSNRLLPPVLPMRSFWLCAALVGGVALLSLSACSDSSDVGLGVGPDSLRGGQPVTLEVPPELDTTHTSPITGENIREQPARSPWRFLVGEVDDPVPGTGVIETEGYVDFAGQSSLPSQIQDASDADSLTAELRLTTDYRHGPDEPMEVEVYDLTEEAPMDSARADTSFGADEMASVAVDTARIAPTNSLVTIELRKSWIGENLDTLQDTSNEGSGFENDFLGFTIRAPNSQAVVGFSSFDAALRLTSIASGDTVTTDYPALKTFTHIEQRNAGDPPPGFKLLQDGIGVDLTMNWAYGEKEFRNEPSTDSLPADTERVLPLNRAEIFVPADTSALNQYSGGDDFARPLPKGYRIIATRGSDAPSCAALQLPVLSQVNEACVLLLGPSAADPSATLSGALVPNNFPRLPAAAAFTIFEESFRRVRNGQSLLFTEYRVQVADRESIPDNAPSTTQRGLPSTLPVLVPVDGDDPGPPRATLTVTPL